MDDFLAIDLFFGNFVFDFSPILNLEQQSHLETINTLVTIDHNVFDTIICQILIKHKSSHCSLMVLSPKNGMMLDVCF